MAFAFSSLMVKIGVNIKDLTTGLNKATGKLQAFNKKNGAAMKQLGTQMLGIGIAATAASALAVRSFAKFEAGLTTVMTLVNDVNGDIRKEFEETTRRLSKTFGVSTDILLKSLFDIQSATGDTVKAMEIYEAATKLSVAGNASMEQSTSGLLTLMESYGDSFTGAADAADFLFKTQEKARATVGELAQAMGSFLPLAAQMDVDIDELGSVFAQMTVAMGNSAEASTAMNNILKAMLTPTKEMSALMAEKLGVTAQSAIQERGMVEVLKVLSKVRKEELGTIVPGIRGLKGLGAVTANLTGIEEDLLDIRKRAGAVQTALMKVEEDAMHQLSKTKAVMADLWREIGRSLVPAVLMLAQVLKETMDYLITFKEAFPKTTTVMIQLAGAIGVLLIPIGLLLIAIPSLITMWGTLILVLAKTKAGLLAFGPAIIVIVALAAALGAYLYMTKEIKKAEKELQNSHENLMDQFAKSNGKAGKSIEELNKSYKQLTDVQRAKLDAAEEEQKAIDRMIKTAQKQGSLNDEQKTWLSEKTIGIQMNVKAIKEEYQATLDLMSADEQSLFISEKAARTKAETAELTKLLTDEMKELGISFRVGATDEEHFANQTDGLIAKMKDLGMSAKEIVDSLQELSDNTRPIEINVAGIEEYATVQDRIRDLQQQIVLSELTGNEQRIQSHKFMLQNKLGDINLLVQKEKLYLEQQLIGAKQSYQESVLFAKKKYKGEEDLLKEALEQAWKFYNDQADIIEEGYNAKTKAYKAEGALYVDITGDKIKAMTDEGTAEEALADVRKAIVKKAEGELEEEGKKVNQVKEELLEEAFKDEERWTDKSVENIKKKTRAVKDASIEEAKAKDDAMKVSADLAKQVADERIALSIKIRDEILRNNTILVSSFQALARAARAASAAKAKAGSGTGLGGKSEGENKKYHAGTSNVPRTGLYELKRGEGVVQEGGIMSGGGSVAATLARGSKSGGGGVNLTLINQITPDFINAAIASDPNTIINEIGKDIVRDGKVGRAVKFSGGRN